MEQPRKVVVLVVPFCQTCTCETCQRSKEIMEVAGERVMENTMASLKRAAGLESN